VPTALAADVVLPRSGRLSISVWPPIRPRRSRS